MNSLRTYLWICGCLAVGLAALPLSAQEAEIGEKPLTAADVKMDDGSGPDGNLIIPKKMAMRCGISSKDAKDKEKIRKCLDTLASDGLDGLALQTEMMHNLSQNALELGLKNKATAGDYEDKQEEKLSDDSGVQPGSPAAGGEAAADGSDLRTKQTQNAKMSASSALNTVKMIEVYSARMGLDSMEYYFKWDAPYRQVEEADDGGENG